MPDRKLSAVHTGGPELFAAVGSFLLSHQAVIDLTPDCADRRLRIDDLLQNQRNALRRLQSVYSRIRDAALATDATSDTGALPESPEAARARIVTLLTQLAEAHVVLWTESPYMAADIRRAIEQTAAVYGIQASVDKEQISLDAVPQPPRPESCLRCRGTGTDKCQRCAGSGLEPVAPYLKPGTEADHA
jgi:hypothetical protein